MTSTNLFSCRLTRARSISQVVVSPDGKSIAWSCDGPQGSQVIYRAPLKSPGAAGPRVGSTRK